MAWIFAILCPFVAWSGFRSSCLEARSRIASGSQNKVWFPKVRRSAAAEGRVRMLLLSCHWNPISLQLSLVAKANVIKQAIVS